MFLVVLIFDPSNKLSVLRDRKSAKERCIYLSVLDVLLSVSVVEEVPVKKYSGPEKH